MFNSDTINAVYAIALEKKIDPATLLAIAEIESGGRTSYLVKGVPEPAIRFEGHYFDRRLTGSAQKQARNEGLASPLAGKIRNPSQQAARWALLDRACRINRKAALESTSWGLGQVMGAHWQWLGLSSIDDLVGLARRSVAGQIMLMTHFIIRADLVQSLHNRQWQHFAKRYNGPNYAKNQYDLKLEAAWIGWKIRLAHEIQHLRASNGVDKQILAI